MRKIFTLALAAFMFAAYNKTNDQTANDQMVNSLTDYHAHAIPDSYR
ncbi:MAG: hypothetical protein IKO26_09700 [Paludibacteraceae bacterium]|nr:hypothetical protein [Paludibacteraceae bacterium]